jgi:hypothetical protein
MISTVGQIDRQLARPGLSFAREVAAVAASTTRLAESIAAELRESQLDGGERRRVRSLLHGLESSLLALSI